MPIELSPATFRRFLVGTFEVWRKSPRREGTSVVYDEAVVATVAGRLRPLQLRENQMAAQLEVTFDHILYVEADADVQRDDIIRAAGDSTGYRVIEAMEPSHMGFHREVRVRQEVD